MFPLSVSKEFPTTEGLSRDCYSAKIISSAYASSQSELNSILQYLYHSFIFKGGGRKQIAEDIEGIAVAEMFHLKLLGETLLALGTQPVFAQNPPAMFNFYSAKFVSYSCNFICMIEDDIRAEQHAVRSYTKMLAMLKNEGVKVIVERILQDEKLHLEKFQSILRELKS